MRGAPQKGFLETHLADQSPNLKRHAAASRNADRDFQRQNKRKPERCQRITVSGSTIVKASRIRGAIRYKQTKTIRSKLLKTERRRDLRRSTFS